MAAAAAGRAGRGRRRLRDALGRPRGRRRPVAQVGGVPRLIDRTGEYAYGDNDLAARRLELVASVFEKPSRRLLNRASQRLARAAGVAVDLGCGPGLSTRLVHDVIGARHTVGLD